MFPPRPPPRRRSLHAASLAYTHQSLTKFYDGHNVTVGGAVASATKELDERIHFYSNMHGNILRYGFVVRIRRASQRPVAVSPYAPFLFFFPDRLNCVQDFKNILGFSVCVCVFFFSNRKNVRAVRALASSLKPLFFILFFS